MLSGKSKRLWHLRLRVLVSIKYRPDLKCLVKGIAGLLGNFFELRFLLDCLLDN